MFFPWVVWVVLDSLRLFYRRCCVLCPLGPKTAFSIITRGLQYTIPACYRVNISMMKPTVFYLIRAQGTLAKPHLIFWGCSWGSGLSNSGFALEIGQLLRNWCQITVCFDSLWGSSNYGGALLIRYNTVHVCTESPTCRVQPLFTSTNRSWSIDFHVTVVLFYLQCINSDRSLIASIWTTVIWKSIDQDRLVGVLFIITWDVSKNLNMHGAHSKHASTKQIVNYITFCPTPI